MDIVNDSVSLVPIRGTRKKVKIHWLKPYTLERLTEVWLERDMASASLNRSSENLKDLVREPYFAFKEAALIMLNNDIKIRLWYPILWRWLAHRYNETQIQDIVAEGKKKLPLMAHYKIMMFSLDMRTDMMKMTKKEAEEYRQEQLSVANLLSSKTSQAMGSQNGDSVDGKEISVTGAS